MQVDSLLKGPTMNKRGKRGHNEGSIYQRKDGYWVAAMTVNLPFGQTKRVSRYRKTATEARKALRELQRQQEDGVQMLTSDPRLSDYLERWLTDSARPAVRPKTYAGYRSIVERRINPRIGHLKLSQVTPPVIQRFYLDLAEQPTDGREAGLSAYSCVNTHRVLRKALGQALKWSMILRNPCDLVDAPRVQRKEMQTLTATQVRKLLDGTRDDRFNGLYALAVSTGLRLGELLGLRWSDVDADGRRLFVRRSLQRVSGTGLVFSEPKTKKSRRTVMLSRHALATLKEHRVRQIEERLAAGSLWTDDDLVFTNLTGGPLDPGTVSSGFKRIESRIEGLPTIRFHDLRHTAATLLLQAGTHPKLVSEMLGHATITLTLDTYSHVIPTMHAEAADAMDALLLGA